MNIPASYNRTQTKAVWTSVLIVLALLSAMCVKVFGQTSAFSGTVTGMVTDASGAVLPGAKVIATNVATGLQTQTQANNDGVFSIPNIAAGHYVVRIEAPGFNAFEKRGILLDPNGVVRVDSALQVGEITATVQVTDEAPLLETQQTTLDQTISHDFVESLPNVVSGGSRDITTLLQLAPGVSQGANSYQYNIAGGRSFQTELDLDGVPIVYTPLASVPLTNKPDQDIIAEVQVQTGVSNAEWGHASGGIGTFVSRSGTNQYHGDVVLLLRNTILDAKPYNSLTKTQDQQFELPMSIGGPIIIPHLYNGRNKSFFFFNYSAYRTHSSNPPITTTVPTVLERTGNFSELPAGQLLYDPSTGLPFPAIPNEAGCLIGRCIPQSRISATSASYLSKFIPQPTNSNVINNYIGHSPTSDRENHYFGKIDQRIGAANTLHGSLRWDVLDVVGYTGPFGPTLGTWNLPETSKSLVLSDDTILRPNLVNSISVAYSRWTLDATGTPQDLFPQIPGSYGQGFPEVIFDTLYGGPVGNQLYLYLRDPFWNLTDSISATVNKHSLKFGVRYSDYIGQQGTGIASKNGLYTFSSLETGHGQAQAGDPFASYLLGLVDSASLNVPNRNGISSRYYAFYGQDSWRVTPKLTANIGLRWDIQTPFNQPGSANISLTAPNPGAGNLPGATIYTGVNGTGSQFMPTWFGGVAPRVGIAWNPIPNTVVRAGYGIMYAPLEYILSASSFPGTGLTSPSPGVPVLQWDTGFTAGQVVPYSTNQNPSISNGNNGLTFDPTRGRSDRLMDTQYAQFDVQQSWKGTLFDAAYIGQFSHHIQGSNGSDVVNLANINQLPVSDLRYGALLTDSITNPAVIAAGFQAPYPGFTGTLAQALRAFPQYQSIINEIPIGNSTYNALILKSEKRLSHGIQFLASYTISKNLTDVGTSDNALPAPQDQYDRRFEKSVSQTDIPRVLNLTYLWQLPIGHGRTFLPSGIIGRVLEGFFVSGNQVYQAGFPIAISAPANALPIFNGVLHLSRGQGPFTTGDRHNIRLGNSLYGTTGTTYLNEAAFAEPAPFMIPDPNHPNQLIANPVVVSNPSAALGNLKYVLPNVRTLGFFNENLHVGKSQVFHERYTFDFGVDFFNAFNRTNFAGLNTTYGSSAFGTYGAAGSSPRVIQLDSKITF